MSTRFFSGVNYPISIYLRWDDWTKVDQDYDLYLFRLNLQTMEWELVAQSENPQDGNTSYQTPTETIYYVTESETVYGFLINRWYSDRDVHFEAFIPKVAPLNYVVYDRSLDNLADAPSAMTVAALDVNDPYPQENYSSQGPTNGPGGTVSGGYIKPDISAFANVSTVSYGSQEFKGTSSATPHVAGAAALVLSAYPYYSPDQIQNFLETQAIDMGSPGMDNVFGYGRLHLGDAPSVICPQPGYWQGTTNQGSLIVFVTENNPVCQISEGSLNFSFTDNCGSYYDITKSSSFPIISMLFDTGGSNQVVGEFNTVTTARGTFNHTNPKAPICNISGTWEASLGVVINPPTDILLSNSSVDEGQPVNTVVGILATVDQDPSDSFTYSLVPGDGSDDNSSFNICDDQLRTSEKFNYATQSSYSIRVRSTDSANSWIEKTFMITISQPTENDPPIGLQLSNNIIEENKPENSLVGILSTSDPDQGDEHKYKLVSGDGAVNNKLFNIAGNKLQSSAVFDYETANGYSIRIRSMDSGGLSVEAVFSILIKDVNEKPTGIALSSTNVDEGLPANTVVGSFSTVDPDEGNTFTYSLVSGTGDSDNAAFKIDGSDLFTKAMFDYEVKNSYLIRVRSKDSGGLWIEKAFTIFVIDVEDECSLLFLPLVLK